MNNKYPTAYDVNKKAIKDLIIKPPKSEIGLSVNFEGTTYLYPVKANQKNKVVIKMTGNEFSDRVIANAMSGFDRQPFGYTWHDLDDYNPMTNTCTMQLVKTAIHRKCNPHYGSVEIVKMYFPNENLYAFIKDFDFVKMKDRIIIRNSEQNINRDDIKDFEEKYSLLLPENYKEFLLKYNGGQIYDEEYEHLDTFNSLKYGELTIENDLNTYCILEELIEKHYLPIGESYGNPMTLCLKEGADYGKIILFYFDRKDDSVVIADSLEQLFGVTHISDL